MTAIHSEPDWQAASQFVSCIAGESNPVVTFQVFDDKKENKSLAEYRTGRLSDPAIRKWLRRKNREGCGIYVCVNETDGAGRSRKNIVSARANWVDFDGTPTRKHLQEWAN